MKSLLRFGTVGGAAFIVDTGSFNIFRVLEVGPLTSKTLAVVLATSFAYLGNRHWTFEDRTVHSEVGGYTTFFALNGVGLGIALACLATSYHLLGLTSTLAQNVSANGVGVALGMVFRWWAYRRFVFHPEASYARSSEPQPAAAEAS